MTTSTPPSPRRIATIGLAGLAELTLALPAWGIGWLLGRSPWADLRCDAAGLLAGLAATLPMVAPLPWLAGSTLPQLRRIRAFVDETVRPWLGGAPIILLAWLCLGAGLGEELLFRGAIQGGLEDRLGPVPGLLLASALFGLMHAITPTYAWIAGFLGLYLGLVWNATGNLLAPAVAHSLYDFAALIYLLRSPPLPADDPPAPEG